MRIHFLIILINYSTNSGKIAIKINVIASSRNSFPCTWFIFFYRRLIGIKLNIRIATFNVSIFKKEDKNQTIL